MTKRTFLLIFSLGVLLTLFSVAPAIIAQSADPNSSLVPLPGSALEYTSQSAQPRDNLTLDSAKTSDTLLPPRLKGETVQQYLARNPYHYANRLPAGNFTVNYFSDIDSEDVNPGDSICADAFGNCGLRAAIMEANALDPGSIINIPSSTIMLTITGQLENFAVTGDLDIKNSMTINGAGADVTFIDGNGIDRVFDIYGGVVDINGVSITGGDVSGIADGVENDGGGIWVNCGVDVMLNRVAIFENTAIFGAGIQVGEYCGDTQQVLYISESVIYNNTAVNGGAGMDIYQDSNVTISNSTFSGNSAPGTGGIIIEPETSNNTFNASHMTIADNISTQNLSAGLANGAGTTTVINSIIAYNGNNGTYKDCGGAAFTSGDNVYTTDTCTTGASDLVDSSLILGDLQYNGGTTMTHSLSLNSTAVGIDTDLGSCPAIDQRGFPRPIGNGCDSGAFELGLVYSDQALNGDFELDADTNGIPDGWIGKNLTGDKIKCNTDTKVVAFSGLCAVQIKGGVGENSKFTQLYPGASNVVVAGDELSIAAAVRTKGTVTGGFVTLKGSYLDSNLGNAGKFKTKITIAPGSVAYTQFASSSIVVEGQLSSLKMEFGYKGISGKYYIDLVQIFWGQLPARATSVDSQFIGTSSTSEAIIPLPESQMSSR